MKSLVTVALLALSAQSFAFGLESHYGKLSIVNGKHACTLTNNTGADLDIKRVHFNLERRSGKNRDLVATKSVHSVIYDGETMTVVSNATRTVIGRSCKFLAR